jgi:hypothetical protein
MQGRTRKYPRSAGVVEPRASIEFADVARILARIGGDEVHSKSVSVDRGEAIVFIRSEGAQNAGSQSCRQRPSRGSSRSGSESIDDEADIGVSALKLMMKEQNHAAVVTFTELESALEELVQLAHLAGFVADDLIALLDGGLGVNEILEVIAVSSGRAR